MVQKLLTKLRNKQLAVCIVGVGYVGYPLACEFSHHVNVIGYDIDSGKVNCLNKRHSEPQLSFSDNETVINDADVVIICVPTPININKTPNLKPIESASNTVGRNLRSSSIVVVESTYYPGVTEEFIVPILEDISGLCCGEDFWVGYSPERINPGDDEHVLSKITKIVSGQNSSTTQFLSELYSLITDVYPVKNIKTAEAAKVIENIQRDLNIALINELSIIMHRLDIDIDEVLDAAATKWNFVRYSPGLVGGHCIPVDPYYLVYKAKELGYYPKVILAGREINDSMPKYVVDMAVSRLVEAGKIVRDSKVLVMGLTYKENVSDCRESPSVEIICELRKKHIDVFACDPFVSSEQINKFGAKPYANEEKMDCIILAVKHKEFCTFTRVDLDIIMPNKPILIDVKGVYKNNASITDNYLYNKL